MTPNLILSVLLIVAAALFWMWAERRRGVAQLHALLSDTLLDELPGTYIYWGPNNKETAATQLSLLLDEKGADWETLRDRLAPKDRDQFSAMTEALRKRGVNFLTSFDLPGRGAQESRILRIHGTRAQKVVLDTLYITDITREMAAGKKAQDRLAGAETERGRVRAILDNLLFPAWAGSDGTFTDLDTNRAFRRLFGAEPSGPDAQAVAALVRRAIETKAVQRLRRHVVADGERRLYSITLTPVEGIGVVGQAIDVSRDEKLEDELSRHIAAHSEVLETLAVAIAIYGPDTKLEFYNNAYVKLWKLDPKWLATKPTMGEILEQLRADRRLQEMADFRIWRDKEVATFTSLLEPVEEYYHLPDGRTVRKRVSPRPFGGLSITFEDVTDRLSLEAEYNTLIEVQRHSLDNLYEAIALIGADGKLKLCNAAFQRIWKFSDEDIAHEPHVSQLVDIARPLIRQEGPWDEQRQRLIATVTSRTPESDMMTLADGTVLQHSTVPLPDGMVLRTFVDISDRMRVEQALRERAEAMEAADALKTQFIANVSYELRTPLSSVIGFAQIMQQGIVGEVNEEQADYLDSILQSSQELLDLINDILDLGTIEAGYLELVPELFAIHPLMENVHAMVRDRARAKDLDLTVSCPPDIGDMCADERRVKQVMFNLANNAIAFTPAGGAVELNAVREGEDVVFTVTDSGVGIPDRQIERIFDKFERGSDPMIRQSGSGAGLGLSLVQSLVELHGGVVTLQSELGKGTTVRCRIPAEATTLDDQPASGWA